jgi:hypothetical protein
MVFVLTVTPLVLAPVQPVVPVTQGMPATVGAGAVFTDPKSTCLFTALEEVTSYVAVFRVGVGIGLWAASNAVGHAVGLGVGVVGVGFALCQLAQLNWSVVGEVGAHWAALMSALVITICWVSE